MVKGNSSTLYLDRNMDLYRMRTPYPRPLVISQPTQTRSVPIVQPKGSSCCRCCSSKSETKVSNSSQQQKQHETTMNSTSRRRAHDRTHSRMDTSVESISYSQGQQRQMNRSPRRTNIQREENYSKNSSSNRVNEDKSNDRSCTIL